MKKILTLLLIYSLASSSILCMKSTALETIDQRLEQMAQQKAKSTPDFAWLKEKIGVIIKSPDINSADDLGNTRLHYAAFLENFEALNLLLRMGADPAKINNNDQDFLMILELLINQEQDRAKKMRLTTSYQQLLRALAQRNVALRFQNGDTLLHKAVLMQDAPLVVDLLARIDPNQTNSLLISPLHMAAGEPLVDLMILNQLLVHKANPNLQTELGNTPLHLAAKNFIGNPLTIEKLLEYGANPDIQNNSGDTPINTMLQKLNDLLKEYTQLKKNIATPKHQLEEKFEIIKRAALALFALLQHSKNKNIQDNFGNTPLYHLILLSDTKEPEIKNLLKPLIKMILINAANPNIQNRDGFTPLHAAVSQKDLELVNLLLAYGANPFIRSYKPRTMADIKRGKQLEPDKTPLDIVDKLKEATPELEQIPLLKIEEALLQAMLAHRELGQQVPPLPEPTTIPAIRTPSPLEQESPVQPKKVQTDLERALGLLNQSLNTLRMELQRAKK